jgi:Fe-S cluster assembly protein SufD
MPETAEMTDIKQTGGVFVEQFSRFEKSAPAQADAWLLPIRKAAMARFSELGLPTTADEEWIYTNVAPLAEIDFTPAGAVSVSRAEVARYDFGEGFLAVFVNGRFSAEHSRLAGLPRGVRVAPLSDAMTTDGELLRAHLSRHARFESHAFAALNTAMMTDGIFVHAAKGVVVEAPIHVLHLTVAGSRAVSVHPRTLVVADASAQVTVVETFAGAGEGVYLCNPVCEIVGGENANVDHYKITREAPGAYHVATVQLHLLRSSVIASHAVTLGGGLVRNNISTILAGEGADCHLYGMYMVDTGEHVDNHLMVDHASPHCDSREFFKGVLNGKGRGIFSGRIIVRKDAQKTDAKQTNMSLLLSDDAQVESKPQLEILADDVKCTHGATIGQLSDEAMFYLRSRGLSAETAKSMLVYAFAREGIENLRVEPLREQLDAILFARLPEGQLLAAAS